jgi:acetyl-CoA acyltransferase 2
MRSVFNQPIFIVAAKRTPFGTYLGALSRISAIDLGAHAAKSALMAAKISPQKIDQVIFGNVLQTSKDAIYLARHIGLKCEIPAVVPALTVNRLCGSGLEALVQGARLINSHEAQCVLVGGTENMSQAPHVIRGARAGLSLGQGSLEDSLWESLTDSFINVPMGITAENLAQKYQISQSEVDEYSARSQHLYQEALRTGIFNQEIASIACGSQKIPQILAMDEHPRKDSSIESFKKLPKIFKPDGVIHAGAASGICDGAAALILCNESFAKDNNLKPMAELLSFGITGCDPNIMGIGPVSAIKSAMAKSHIKMTDLSMVEVNEAFAPQALAVKKELSIDENIFNIHGGAIALGHPLGASGARIACHLTHALKKDELGVGSLCIGGGQGIAVVIKAMAKEIS